MEVAEGELLPVPRSPGAGFDDMEDLRVLLLARVEADHAVQHPGGIEAAGLAGYLSDETVCAAGRDEAAGLYGVEENFQFAGGKAAGCAVIADIASNALFQQADLHIAEYFQVLVDGSSAAFEVYFFQAGTHILNGIGVVCVALLGEQNIEFKQAHGAVFAVGHGGEPPKELLLQFADSN